MIFPSVSSKDRSTWRSIAIAPKTLFLKRQTLTAKTVVCFKPQNPDTRDKKMSSLPLRLVNVKTPTLTRVLQRENEGFELKSKRKLVGSEEMLVLCGVGYWVQGFRCFPWLALNFYMTHGLGLNPSVLQIVQNFGNLPMVIKPIYGIFSDAFAIGGARRIPYISIGVILQILSWGQLALNPFSGQSLVTIMTFVLLSNLGASITEVAKDALVAEYGKNHNITGLQSYALMALATGAILGNLLGGYFLMKAPPRTMFLLFTLLLSLQLCFAVKTKENSLGLARSVDENFSSTSVSESFRKQFSELRTAISNEAISRPLVWILASIAMVPSLSGLIFCYQTQWLNLDPSVVGLSRVIGQLMLLSATMIYNRCWRRIPMRKLVSGVQIIYAGSVLLDLVLVKQINLKMGISNEMFALCFSGVADMVAQLKILPFSVLFASLCPVGCEGSLTSLLASALCFSSIVSGCLGIAFALLLGITSNDYSNLPTGILIQFVAALAPLMLVQNLPNSQLVSAAKERKRGLSKRFRKRRRVGRVNADSDFFYRRERV